MARNNSIPVRIIPRGFFERLAKRFVEKLNFGPASVTQHDGRLYYGEMREKRRCDWATTEPNISYHDGEWGVPDHDDRSLFELLILEGAQAGLSWSTILNKRAGYRRAFDNFEPEHVARFNRRRIQKLLADPGIVRNRQKVESAVTNARAFL